MRCTKIKFLLVVFLIVLPLLLSLYSLRLFAVQARDQSVDFQQALSFAKNIQGSIGKTVQNFNYRSLPQYTDNPSQSGYYGGITQVSDSLKQPSAAAVSQDPKGAVSSSISAFTTRPRYEINQKSESIQKSSIIQSGAYNISGGISDDKVDCQQVKTDCTTTYTQKTCNESMQFGNQSCHNQLTVTITPQPIKTKTINIDVAAYLEWCDANKKIDAENSGKNGNSKKNGNSENGDVCGSLHFVIDLKTGALLHYDGGHSYPYDQPIVHASDVMVMPCDASLQVTYLGYRGTDRDARFEYVRIAEAPSCANNFILDFTIYKNVGSGITTGTISYQFSEPQPPVISDAWSDNCSTLNNWVNQGICRITNSAYCIDGPSTKTISGIPVTRTCWDQETDFFCNGFSSNSTVFSNQPSNNDCTSLKAAGCTQINSTCTSFDPAQKNCTNYLQTYECPQQSCASTGIACGGNFFCMDGKCATETPTQNMNIGQASAELAGVNAAGQQMSTTQDPNVHVFTGQPLSCREIGFGDFNNCCADKGWGQDIGLAHCNNEEKQLGLNKQNYLTTYVGDECDKSLPLVGCIEKSKVYCSFPSKLARIIQEQGRFTQLGINFGDGDNPNCQGLNISQLQSLDFSKINFCNPPNQDPASGICQDLVAQQKLPNPGQVSSAVQAQIQAFYDAKASH